MTGALIETIAYEVGITSPTTYQVRGRAKSFPDPVSNCLPDWGLWRQYAGELLGRLIYDAHYLGKPLDEDMTPPPGKSVSVVSQEDPELRKLLEAANTGTGWLNEGWRVRDEAPEGGRFVEKGGLTLAARADEIQANGSSPPDVGATVAIKFPKHVPYASPGFYTAISDQGPARADVIRVYVNTGVRAAPELLRSCTMFLNATESPATVKVINHVDGFDRPDALVVYIEQQAFANHHVAMGRMLDDHRDGLSPQVPGFAHVWMPGVGLAEEPPESLATVRSFGEHRCQLVGQGLAEACRSSGSPMRASERVATVRQYLMAQHYDPDRLYLNPGSRGLFSS